MIWKYLAIIIFLLCIVLGLLFSGNINETGHSSHINGIFAKFNDNLLLNDAIVVDGNVYYHRTGFLSNWELYIYGVFSQTAFDKIMGNPSEVGLPKATIGYEEQYSIESFVFKSTMPSVEVSKKLLLEKVHRHSFKSLFNDNMIYFQWHKGTKSIKLYILGKSKCFIMIITNVAR